MATIIEGAMWTLTEEAAEHLVEKGILKKCIVHHVDILETDKPIYHINPNAAREINMETIHDYIVDAQKYVKDHKQEASD